MKPVLKGLLERYGLLLLDAVLVVVTFFVAYHLRYTFKLFRAVQEGSYQPIETYLTWLILFTFSLLIAYQGAGLYHEQRGRSWLEEMGIIVNGVAISTVIVILTSYFIDGIFFSSRLMLFYIVLLTLAAHGGARLIDHVIEANRRKRGIGVERALIIGAGEIGRSVMRTIVARSDLGYAVIGYLDDNPDKADAGIGRIPGLGTLDDIAQVLAETRPDVIFITLPWVDYPRILEIAGMAEARGCTARIVPDLFQLKLTEVQMEDMGGIPLLNIRGPRPVPRLRNWTKRMMDLAIILIGLPFIFIPLALVALAIKLDSEGPVFFRQRRVGKDGRTFGMLKFRSMVKDAEAQKKNLEALNEADGPLFKIKADPRITRVGRYLRKWSIDEFPQIINVLKGEMSLVGPRPGTPAEVAEYEAWQHQRLQVAPGMTGLSQVSGRSDIPFAEMCLLDIYYIENWSIALDIRILMRTIPKVLRAEGAY
jgi:exopolysaccharide biosynthesis polyprenyl glycosylphosphotransferase